MATRRPLVLVGGELKELPAGDTMSPSLVGATTVGAGLLSIPNPSALRFLRLNADNTVSALAAADFRSAIGAGTSSFDGAFSSLSGKPTTLSGYGVTDAQPLDSDLTSIAALTTTSFGRSLLTQADAAAARTTIGAGTSSFNGAYASLTGIPSTFTPAAHNQAWSTITTTPTTLSGYGITNAQGLDADLTALAGLSTTGIVSRTGAGTAATRTITGTAGQVIVSNGDGAAGNPTLSLPQDIATTSTPTFAGAYFGGRINSSVGEAMALKGSNGFIGYYELAGSTLKGYLQYVASNGSMRLASNSGGVEFYAGGSSKMLIASAGSVRLNAYGAGTLITDSSGNVTASSDRRLKNVSGKFTRGLAAIMKIQPKVFTWKPESGMNTDDVNVGFIAQDVQGAIPEAVGSMKTSDVEEDDGTGKKVKKSKREASEFLTLSDRPIIAAIVNAVQELSAQIETLKKAKLSQ